MGLTYLRNTCMPGFLESTQGRGHLKSCLLGPRPALTGLAGAALGDPSSKGQGLPDHCYRQWHRLHSGGLRAGSTRGCVWGLACALPACWSALSPAGSAERCMCAQEVLKVRLPGMEEAGAAGTRTSGSPSLDSTFSARVFPVSHVQTIRRGEEGHCSQQRGLQRYSLSFFCSNNSFLFLPLPLLPCLA